MPRPPGGKSGTSDSSVKVSHRRHFFCHFAQVSRSFRCQSGLDGGPIAGQLRLARAAAHVRARASVPVSFHRGVPCHENHHAGHCRRYLCPSVSWQGQRSSSRCGRPAVSRPRSSRRPIQTTPTFVRGASDHRIRRRLPRRPVRPPPRRARPTRRRKRNRKKRRKTRKRRTRRRPRKTPASNSSRTSPSSTTTASTSAAGSTRASPGIPATRPTASTARSATTTAPTSTCSTSCT